MKTNSLKTLSVIMLTAAIQSAAAGNITDINVSVMPNKQRVIKVKFDKDIVEPSGFITATPARIALDFPGTGIALQQQKLSFNDNLLRQVEATQGNNYTRLLVNLTQESQYNAQIKGNEVWIYITEAQSVNTAPTKARPAPPMNTAPAHEAHSHTANAMSNFNIDFHKGANGSGVVEYSTNFSDEPVVKVSSDRLVITLKNHPLATQDQRNLDVTDFSTPIRTVAVKRIGNDTQITIRNQGAWTHKITGSNGRQTISVTPERNTSSQSTAKKSGNFKGKIISLDFQNIDVRTLLQILAKESGTNIVASDSVQGKMTLSLKDVPWDQALNLILDARGLDMKREGNIINVAPRAEMLQKVRDDLAARKEIDELGPLVSRTFQLKYKDVDEFREILRIDKSGSSSDNSRSILSSRGSALIDPSTNTLIITDNQYIIQKFEKLIDELDVPARQVMVEARIVEAAEGVSRDLGVKFGVSRAGRTAWGASYNDAIANHNLAVGAGNQNNLINTNPNVNLPLAAAVNSISLVRNLSSGALALELSALETDNRSKTISTPRVLTQDRKEAEIKQGFQIPYTTRNSDGAYQTSFKDAVMSLKVTPRITPDNKIILDVAINKDEPDSTYISSEGEPGISTKYVKTQAMIEDGGTLVVGGIYQEIHSNAIRKVPVLGDIPVLGNLFKSRARSQSRNELLFFITPRIMGQENSVLRY